MKRIVTLFVSIIMLLPMIVACGSNKTEPTDTEGRGLAVADLENYNIIYSDSVTSKDFISYVRDFQNALKKKFGVRLAAKTDYLAKGETAGELEILIGRTNRAESAEIEKLIKRADDYAIRMVGKKLIVMAVSDSAVEKALRVLLNSIDKLDRKGEYFFTAAMEKTECKQYAVDNIVLGEKEMSEYTVVYANDDWGKKMANDLCDMLETKYGYTLKKVNESDAGNVQNKLYVGSTKAVPSAAKALGTGEYFVGAEQGNVFLYAKSPSLTYSAVSKLASMIDGTDTPTVTLDLKDGVSGSDDNSLSAMTFNVWVGSITDSRASHVIETIKKYMPDTLGVQEASEEWIIRLKNGLSEDYGYVGVGRDKGGSGEHSGIFYKKSTLKLIDDDTKWLSSTPDKVSKVEGSICNRVFTYAVFERKSDGTRFMHVNTHTDHTSDENVRLEQVKVLMEFVTTCKYKELPVIISGDLNAVKAAASIQHVLKNGMKDSLTEAMVKDEGYTFATRVIDYVMFSENDFSVYEYEVYDHKYGNNDPSDHCPVIVRYEFK